MNSMKVYVIKKYGSGPNEKACGEVVKVCLTEDDAKDILYQTGAELTMQHMNESLICLKD